MEFCDDCGSMMKKEDQLWICTACGHRAPVDPEAEYVVTDDQEVSHIIESGEETVGLPTTSTICPNCSHDEAYWYLQQIRAADESETRFFVCTDCEHKWREDDH